MKTVAYGYRFHEAQKPKLNPDPFRKEIEILKTDAPSTLTFRPVEMVSLGPHVEGASLPHPDHSDPETTLLGQNKRVCFDNVKPNRKTLRRFRRFVKKWISENLTALSSETDISIEAWLAKTNYPAWRKKELLDNWNFYNGNVTRRHFVVNGFVKDETYLEYKNSRGINARTDMFKVAVGPIFKCIEKELFKNPWFIKYVPVPQRARLIYETLYDVNSQYYATDHTSFEGHFTKAFMESCEFLLYEYMTQNLPDQDRREFMCYVHEVLGGMNHVVFKHFSYKIKATRMTGEMCTSLGNGFSNLMMILFVCQESGFDTVGFVEGDDSIFKGPKDLRLREEIFKELGFEIRLEVLDDIHTASFCGNVFAPGDFFTITNPLDVLLSFGWTTSKYVRSKPSKYKRLLRSKALSLLYEYRGCPILKNLALYALRVTEGYRALLPDTNEYIREQMALQLKDMKENGLPIVQIPNDTRMLVEDLYKIPIELQFYIENYLDSLTSIQVLDMDLLNHLFHKDQVNYFQNYVLDIENYESLNFPNLWIASPNFWDDEFISKVNLKRTALFF